MDNNSILAPLDTESLKARGLLHPGPRPGSQRLHKCCILSNVEFNGRPLTVPIDSPEAEEVFSVIPVGMMSTEAIIYSGFTKQKASDIWTGWIGGSTSGEEVGKEAQARFLELMLTGVRYHPLDCWGDDDAQWRGCMDSMGLNDEVQDSIMDPVLKDLRLCGSCVYWVEDTVEMRYRCLEPIQRESHRREERLRAARGLGPRQLGYHGGEGFHTGRGS